MAVCVNGHQMDRYARICPTCGAAENPKWRSIRRHRHEEQELRKLRREAHWMLIPLLIVGLVAVYLAFDSNHPTTPEAETCNTARALLVTYFAPTGEQGAFTEKATGERLAVGRILASESEIGDAAIKAALEKFSANTDDNGGFPDPGAMAELVQTCRAKKYIP